MTAAFLVFGRFGWFGADACIDRRRCPYRSTQMSVSTDADGFSSASTPYPFAILT